MPYPLHKLTQPALLVIGLAAMTAYNWLLWRRDRALAERLRANKPPVPELQQYPKVSALVAAWNEGPRIDAHIQSFLALSYPAIELILCAGGNDDTLLRARSYASERIVVLEQRPGEGKQRALARCLEHASGEIIYLTDADCLFNNEALLHLLAPLITGKAVAATGVSCPLPEQQQQILPAHVWAAETYVAAHASVMSQGLLGRNAMLTHASLAHIGGMNYDASTGTDYQLAKKLLQAGINIRFVPESIVPSVYPEKLGIYRHKQSRWLRNVLIYGWQYHVHHEMLTALATILTGVAMLHVPLLALIRSRWLLSSWLLLFVHAVASRLRYLYFAARLGSWQPPPILLLLSPAVLIVDFAVWASCGIDLIHSRRRTRW